jgi:hypothetical protein
MVHFGKPDGLGIIEWLARLHGANFRRSAGLLDICFRELAIFVDPAARGGMENPFVTLRVNR